MKTSYRFTLRGLAACAAWALAAAAQAQVYDVTVDGSDAIWLAGRTDIVIPAADQPWPGGLLRHGGPTPEEILETVPSFLSVVAGDVIKALDPAVGGISFFNGFGAPLFGPGGNGASGSSLTSFGGISSYIGPQGPLVGVFLSDAIPSAGAPAGLDFSPAGLGIDFLSLSPLLGQIFYIGDGKTAGGDFQSFIAPVGATRVFFGIPDGFGFGGAPGAYDDNDGSYAIRIGVNQVPGIPEPETYALMLAGLALLRVAARRRPA
ncbi:MAG: PEP-CTERM sorting domain-containing protein [Caldimonas sp.]